MATKTNSNLQCTKSRAAIKRTLRALRKMIESSSDPIETRMAWEVENAIRWITEKTVGWQEPHKSVVSGVSLLEQEMQYAAECQRQTKST